MAIKGCKIPNKKDATHERFDPGCTDNNTSEVGHAGSDTKAIWHCILTSGVWSWSKITAIMKYGYSMLNDQIW